MCKGKDPGGFYDAVYGTLKHRKKFPIDPRQVREMMRVIAICRKQDPGFPGKLSRLMTSLPSKSI